MKIHLTEEEWFPVLVETEESCKPEVDIHPRTLKRWRKIAKAFHKMQAEMSEAFEKALYPADRV